VRTFTYDKDVSPSRPQRLYAGYAFDLDGTVYLGESLIPGARETIETIRRAARPVLFISNNPLRTREEYAEKLTRLGVPTTADQIINSSYVLVQHLQRTMRQARLLVIGEQSVKEELERGGLTLSDDPLRTDIVVACFDRTFDYRKLQQAFDAIRAGARFIATNRDPYCPVPGGGLPDCGAIIGAIEACTGHQVEEVVGKPSVIMAQVVMERLGVPTPDTLVVGDRLETDVALARTGGMRSALVLTGSTSREMLVRTATGPDYVLSSITEVLPIA
jgi:phosphoglycolate/pyridoxal phosphate phosphatase family enzyme